MRSFTRDIFTRDAGRPIGQGIVVDRGVAAAIDGAIREDGSVRDSASDNVRRARGRVTTLQGRLRGILQNQPGEVTEQVQAVSFLSLQAL